MRNYLIIVYYFLLTASGVSADTNQSILFTGSIGATIEDFHYEEEDEQGKTIDKEEGTLPGLSLNLMARYNPWFIAGDLSHKQAEVDYTAYPSSPNELNSRTSEKINEASLKLGYQQTISTATKIEYQTGIGYRTWDRDIHSLPDIAGLDESYEWSYFSLGIEPIFQIDPKSSISLMLQVNRAFNATLDVAFKSDIFDPVTLDMGAGDGFYLEGTWLYQLDQISALGISPYLNFWRFKQSDQFELSKNGIPVGSVHEPRSQTRSVGLLLFYTHAF